MFVAFFNKYKTYIYLVSIVGIICILTMEHSIIEGDACLSVGTIT